MACHATPRHAIASRRSSSVDEKCICIPSRKGHKRKFILFLHDLFFANSFFWPCLIPCRRVVPDWDWHTLRDAFIYQPLIGLAICSVPVPQSLHGRYISLLSSAFPSPPSYNEPPFPALRSSHPHRVLSFMAAFHHSSLVFQTPPPDHDHFATHPASVSLQRHGS
jgi:hypothetical protein